MSVTVRIPTYLAGFAGGLNAIVVNGAADDTAALLNALWKMHPALRDRIVDEQGEVRQHINIFVGSESIRFADGLKTPVPDGSEVLIVPAVSGG
ncbi:MAG TPA: MoaD/ThiS family protein [Candidatus Angelobacter sp.]|nr:MoaD/ThiS family protein [Candidatus Angelobacter sp.]